MDNKNEILQKNVRLLSVMGDHERGMMPQTEAPLPSVAVALATGGWLMYLLAVASASCSAPCAT